MFLQLQYLTEERDSHLFILLPPTPQGAALHTSLAYAFARERLTARFSLRHSGTPRQGQWRSAAGARGDDGEEPGARPHAGRPVCPAVVAEIGDCRSGRQGRDPAGGSPAVPIARFRHVAMPQRMWGNRLGSAWCKRPGRPVAIEPPWWVQPEGQASMGG